MLKIEDVLNAKHGTATKEAVHWIGEVPPKCQLSGRKLTKRFVDGRIPGRSTWAIMHPDYFASIGGRVGMGNGQLYERQQDSGRWMKIEG